MNKVCTTVQQSRRLLNLGLDPESADMIWCLVEKDKDEICTLCVKAWSGSLQWQGQDIAMPAWSLSALLELMPQRITGPFGELWHLGLEKDWDKVSYIVYYENKNSFVQRKAKDPIDACIEMIDWLIKNGQKLLSK